MRKKIIISLLLVICIAATYSPTIVSATGTGSTSSIEAVVGKLQNSQNNNVAVYTTENNEKRAVIWTRGIQGPRLGSGNTGDFKRQSESGYTTYYALTNHGSGWYDVNKAAGNSLNLSNGNFDDRGMCFAGVSANQLYWWMNQNRDYINDYLNTTALNDNKKDELRRFMTSYVGESTGDRSQSGLYKDFCEKFPVTIGGRESYNSNLINDYFINGNQPKPNGYITIPGSPLASSGGFFRPVFNEDFLSQRITTESYSRLQEQMLERMKAGDSVAIVHDAATYGVTHIVTVWGAELDENGNLVAVYTSDTDDQQNYALHPNSNDIIGMKRIPVYKDRAGIARYTSMDNAANQTPQRGPKVQEIITLSLGTWQWDKYFNKTSETITQDALNSITPYSGVYDGKNHPAVILKNADIANIYDVTYRVGDGTWENTCPDICNANTMNVDVKLAVKNNGSINSIKTITAKVEPKPVTINTILVEHRAYEPNNKNVKILNAFCKRNDILPADISAVTVSVEAAVGTMDTPDVGDNKRVKVTDITLSGNKARNYRIDTIADTVVNISAASTPPNGNAQGENPNQVPNTNIPVNVPNVVSRDMLRKTLAAANKAFEGVAESTDGRDVKKENKWATRNVMSILYKSIDRAKQVYDNGNASQNQVDYANSTLENAIGNFYASLKHGSLNKTKPATNQSAILNDIEYAPVYNYKYYIENNPDVMLACNGDKAACLRHFVNYGMQEGRQGCEWFDVNYYRDNYDDLRYAYGTDLKSYYMHYINYGKNENRSGSLNTAPNMPVVSDSVDYSSVYDYDYYISHNPDIMSAYGGDRSSTLNHFINYGMQEGRQGCEWFDVNSYKNANKDLRAIFKNDLKSYYIHYIYYGLNEGRTAVDVNTITDPIAALGGMDYSLVYDYNYYLDNNPDIKAVFNGDEDAALNHFISWGMQEGRIAKESFNVHIYKANYNDLQAAFGEDFTSYYMHYIGYGAVEGRAAK